jgi:kynurenine formamidase
MNSTEFLDFMNKVKVYDLTMPLSIHTPPWPSYMPLQIQYFKRLAGCFGGGMGANGQVIKTSSHVSTHMDGEIHFYGNGRTIGEVPIQEWIGEGAVVDISGEVSDYSLYTPEMLKGKADIHKGDILIINTGYHNYDWTHPEADEVRYMVMHPGPSADFDKWCAEMKFKWIGVDCGSADHPMNTIIRRWQPEHFAKAEAKLKKDYGKGWDEMFPLDYYYQVMHLKLFPKKIVHAECVGGDIDQVSNKRVWIGAFPWRAMEMESCICRILAFDKP